MDRDGRGERELETLFHPFRRTVSERAGSTVVETTGSHSIYVSQPAVVADLIERAASEVGSPAMA